MISKLEEQEEQKQQKQQKKRSNKSQNQQLNRNSEIPLLGYFLLDRNNPKFFYIIIDQVEKKIIKIMNFNFEKKDKTKAQIFYEDSLTDIQKYIADNLKKFPIPVFLNNSLYEWFKNQVGYQIISDLSLGDYINLTKFLLKNEAEILGNQLDNSLKNQLSTIPKESYLEAVLQMNRKYIYFTQVDRKAYLTSQRLENFKKLIQSQLEQVYKGDQQAQHPILNQQNKPKIQSQQLSFFQDKSSTNNNLSNMMAQFMKEEDESSGDDSQINDEESSQEDVDDDDDGDDSDNENDKQNKKYPVQIIQQNKVLNFDEVEQMKKGMVSEYLNLPQDSQIQQKVDFKKSIEEFSKNTTKQLNSKQKEKIQEFTKQQDYERQMFNNMIQSLKEEFDKKQGIERKNFQTFLDKQKADCSEFITHHLQKMNKLQTDLNQNK